MLLEGPLEDELGPGEGWFLVDGDRIGWKLCRIGLEKEMLLDRPVVVEMRESVYSWVDVETSLDLRQRET